MSTADLNLEIHATLQRIESALERRLDLARVNALLSLADPALVLPRPAVAVAVLQPRTFARVGEGTILRSLGAWGPDGEVVFTPIARSQEIHPWRVDAVEWLESRVGTGGSGRAEGAMRVCDGIRLRLVRDPGSSAAEGWLSLRIASTSIGAWRLDRVSEASGSAPLDWRPWRLDRSLLLEGSTLPGALPHWLASAARQLLAVRIPRGLAERATIEVDLRFDEPAPVARGSETPAVQSNAVLVWNSRPLVYPSHGDAEQAVTGRRRRLVHPIDATALGPRWGAWRVRSVGASDSARAEIPPDGYRLALAPRTRTDALSGHVVSAVVLDDSWCRELEREGGSVRVEFDATTGSSANGVPAGTEFQLLDDVGRVEPTPAFLATPSCCGSDGFLAGWLEASREEVFRTLLPPGRSRTIGETVRAVEAVFGDSASVVDPWDLLRIGGASRLRPVFLRLRFRKADLPAEQREVLLRACRSFLDDYLSSWADSAAVIPVDADASRAFGDDVA